MGKLNNKFLAELFRLFYSDRQIAGICNKYLAYHLIPKELRGYKILLKEGKSLFEKTGKAPSLGVISQKYAEDEEVQITIKEIQEAVVTNRDIVIDQLESYIKDVEFQLLSQKVYELYNDGKHDESILLNYTESERILNISVRKDSGIFLQVFGDFQKMMQENLKEDHTEVKKKVPFGIDCLDNSFDEGVEFGDTVLWIMRSGVGKSTVLRWHGLNSAVNGERVLHIQLEGGALSVFNKYTQMWTHESYTDILNVNFPKDKLRKILKSIEEKVNLKRDIQIYAFKKFGESSVLEVRDLLFKYEKVYGAFPTVLVIDSLDLLSTGENPKIDKDPTFLKYKLQRVAQRLKDIATEFNLVVYTATQTSDVPFDLWNDPTRVIDRSYTEGDKTLVKPFSFVFTGNMTLEESSKDMLRIYCDKVRDYRADKRVFRIFTDYDHGKFYDRKKTIEYALEDSEMPIQTTKSKQRGKKIA